MSSLIKTSLIVSFAFLSLLYTNCGRPSKLPGEMMTSMSTEGVLGYDLISSEIIGPKCLSCHANFGTYDGLLSAGVISPGDPEGSKLYQMVVSGQMPRNGTPLSDAEVDAIYSWIEGGAVAKTPSSSGDGSSSPGGGTSGPGSPSTGSPSPGDIPTTGISPTFAWIKANVINARCIVCHRGASAPAGYDLSTYDTVMSGGRVLVGNPAGSTLFKRIDNNSMPPGGPALSDEVKEAIATWIANGAKNDAPAGGLPPADNDVPELPPLEPKFKSIMANILAPRCTACHSSGNASDGVILQDYASVMRQVIPGNAQESELYDVLEDNEMPRSGPLLTSNEKSVIRQWIDSGARNN